MQKTLINPSSNSILRISDNLILTNYIFLSFAIKITGDIWRYNSADEDDFTQCGIFFRDVLNEEERERLVDNIASHIRNAQGFLQVNSHID